MSILANGVIIAPELTPISGFLEIIPTNWRFLSTGAPISCYK